jgi:hypothetical protein
VLYEGKPVGTPDPGAFWRVAPSTTCACCSRRRPRCARSSARTRRDAHAALRLAWPPGVVPRGRADGPRQSALGAHRTRRAGDRSLVADRDRAGRSPGSAAASKSCPSSTAPRGARCRGTTWLCSMRPDTRSPPARSARSP